MHIGRWMTKMESHCSGQPPGDQSEKRQRHPILDDKQFDKVDLRVDMA